MLKFKNLLILFALIAALLMPAGAWADDTGIEVSTDAVFKIAVTGVSGDITLTGSFYLSDVVEISANVKIIGGGYTITAANGKRHFTLSETGNKEFQNLTLKGNSGGGVDITGTGAVNFTNVTFDSNTGTNGAVNINAASTVTFDTANTATFTSNGTTSTTAGALYVQNSSATVTFNNAAVFTSNKAANGGAIYAPNGGNIIFNGAATFTDNTAATSGGAINSAGTLSFASTAAFTSNTATAGDGGAINSTGSVSFASTATFKSNKATAGSGGAVYSTGSLVFTGAATFGTSTTDGNTAGTDGGAIYASAWPTFSSTASFTGNTATSAGGAAYISGTTAFTLSDSYTFTSNTAGTNGGAVYATGALTISGGTFSSNTAATSGGAVYAIGAVTVSSGTFTSNETTGTDDATGLGGAIYSNSGASSITGGTFTTNTAGTNGGAVYAGGTLNISGGTFSSNTGSGSGGAVYSAGALALSGASFDVNEAAGSGGAVYSAGDVSITGGNYTNNTAGLSGGVIYSTGTVTVEGIDFTTTNTAKGSDEGGGAIRAANVVIGSGTTTFSEQKAENGHGGAIYVTGGISGTGRAVFENNTAAASGGAIRIGGVTSTTSSTLSRISFIKNKVTAGSGGAIYTINPITVDRCYFNENQSFNGHGGAIGADGSDNRYSITSSYFLKNGAVNSDTTSTKIYGGAVYIGDGDMLSITSSSFIFNASSATGSSAESKGGAIYTNEINTTTFTNNSFYYNTTGLDGSSNGTGGACYLNASGNGSATVNFCTFTGNSSYGGYGGGLAVNNSSLLIRGTLIVGNTATHGGDICKDKDGSARISSGRDNRIVSYSNGDNALSWTVANGITGASDEESGSWTALSFFIATPIPDDLSSENLFFSGISVGADDSVKLPVIQLDPNKDGAIDQAVNTVRLAPEFDQRGVLRSGNGAAPDIGAFEVNQSGSSSDDDSEYASYTIRSIKISGIPNTLSIVGQTAILHATVTYVNGTTTTTAEPLTWTLKDIEGSNAIRFSDNKNSKTSSTGSVYADGIGVSEITVSARDGAYKDSKKIYVIWHQQDTNIHPNVLNLVNQLNLQLSNDSINFYIMSAGYKDAVSDSSFKSAFKNAWGTEPKVIELNGSSFSSNANFSRAAQSKLDKAYSAGITANINNQETGAVLPVFCIWNFALDDLDEDFNSNGDAIETMTDSEFSAWLFKNLNIGFEITGGEFLPAVSSSNQSSLQSAALKDLVTAEDAVNSGALSVQRGENDVTVSMLAYIANVEPKGSTGSKLLTTSSNQKLLVIPGGNSAKNISGTIWTAEAASSSNNNNSNSGSGSSSGKKSGGGGGGGCNALGLNLIALILLALLFNRKHA